MLMFLVYIGENRFAIESELIVEVVPRVILKKLSHVPPYVAGMLNYGGMPIPVVDLCYLLEEREARSSMHTRILLFKFKEIDREYQIGFIAEKITQTITQKRSDFIDSQVRIREVPYLDGILTDEEGVIQFIDAQELFQTVKGVLFEQAQVTYEKT